MQLIKRITDSDVLGGTPEFIDTVSRYGSRGVVVDHRNNVAMMYMSKTNLYKLPGGGVDEGEHMEAAFLREIMEETGYEAEIIHELGYIEEHKNRNGFMQFSYCYLAKAKNHANPTMLTENEKQLGMVVKWMTLDNAIEVMKDAMQHCDDYSTTFMILREQAILEKAVNILNGEVNHKPMVISIAAVSGGGKTTTTNHLIRKLDKSKALYFDDYDVEGPDLLVYSYALELSVCLGIRGVFFERNKKNIQLSFFLFALTTF